MNNRKLVFRYYKHATVMLTHERIAIQEIAVTNESPNNKKAPRSKTFIQRPLFAIHNSSLSLKQRLR